MKWFRFYDEVLDDPKCQRLAPALFKHWINILCLANRTPVRGTLPPMADIAFGLRLSEARARSVMTDLVAAGLVDRGDGETFQIHGWNDRQRTSDNVAERVAKHRRETAQVTERNGVRNVTETLPHVRGTETETEAEAETENPPTPRGGSDDDGAPAKVSIHDERFARFWEAYPVGHKVGRDAALRWWMRRKPSEALTAQIVAAVEAQKGGYQWQREYGQYIPNPATWLNQGRWSDDIRATPDPKAPRNLRVAQSDDPEFYTRGAEQWGVRVLGQRED